MNKLNKDNRFDVDLKFGNLGEKYIQEIFDGDGKVEVKTERDIWKKTGNLFIEYKCRGKLSGISVSQASTWVYCLYYQGKIEFSLIFNLKELKEKIKKLHKLGIAKKSVGGDDNLSDGFLIPIKEIIK
jgi:predicted DNA binding protein